MPKKCAVEADVVQEYVARPPGSVYEFARRMENLPQWASGLAAGIERDGDDWFTQSPMGRVKVAMAPKNGFGVVDHDVTLPDGTTIHNAFRVTPAGEGSLLTFVVLRQPGTLPDAFRKDVEHVTKDLTSLKQILETAG